MDEVGNLALADHLSHLNRPCSKALPTDIGSWGKEKIGLKITLPKLPFADSKLVEVSKCMLGDCGAAHLVYTHQGKRFSVFIVPEKEISFKLSNERRYTLEFEQHRVRIWKANDQVYALVT